MTKSVKIFEVQQVQVGLKNLKIIEVWKDFKTHQPKY